MNIPNVKIGRNRHPIREYQEGSGKVVYLKNGDNFEFLLHNPSSITVGALIYVNNNKIAEQVLVLHPGQSLWLDCNPISKKKFHFTEYEVKNTKSNLDAIADNGLIKVEFFNETVISQIGPLWTDPVMTYPHWDKQFYGNTGEPPVHFYSQNNMSIGDMSEPLKATMDFFPVDNSLQSRRVKSKSVKTGRVDFQGESNQNFTQVEVDLEQYPAYTYYYKILPESTKQLHASDIKQYCTGCGKKRKKKENFCPSCGNKF